MRKQTTHSGVIAYRLGKKKNIEVLLIRNRGTMRWLIPKGRDEKHKSTREVALMEAWEEGGIKGRLKGKPIGIYKHPKFHEKVIVKLYIMKVIKEYDKWPEMKQRKRIWLPIEEAQKKISLPGLRKMFTNAEEAIRMEEGMMKEFYLIRHGKSSHRSGAASDFDRPLNKRGVKDSSDMGERLAKKGLKPDLIISSPATRAATTAELIAAELSYPEHKIRFDEDLYLCDVEDFQSLLMDLDEKIGKVIVVAHNPGIHMAEYYFSGVDRDNVPTCGVCAFEAKSWKQIKRMSCREIFYDYPKNVVH